MAPESECEGHSDHIFQVFVTRVMSLPVLNDALTLANSIYCTTKEQQYVGVALQAAEIGVCIAANKALPLATPLVKRVVDWTALDEWACKGLDRVEEAAPIITKPTKEIMSTTRNLVLTTLAGDKASDGMPPPTVSAAFTTRATYTVGCMAESNGGRVAMSMADRLLDSAHILVDTYFPPGKSDLNDSDGRDGSLGIKVSTLADKTHRRFKRTIHTNLNVNSNQELDDDDIIITSGHLLELWRRSLFSWYLYMTHQNFMKQIVGRVGRVHLLVKNGADKVHAKVMCTAGTISTLLTRAITRVQKIVKSGKPGSVAPGGVHMVSDLMKDGVDVVSNVMKTGRGLAHTLIGNGVSIANTALSGGLDAVHTVIVTVKDTTYNVVTNMIDTAHTAMRRGVGTTQRVMMNGKTMAHDIVSSSMNATTHIVSSIHPAISTLAFIEYAHTSGAVARRNTKETYKTTYFSLKYAWGIPGEVMEWVVSFIHPNNVDDPSTDDKVCELSDLHDDAKGTQDELMSILKVYEAMDNTEGVPEELVNE